MAEVELDPSQSKLLGALTLTAVEHLGEPTLVVDADGNLCPGWRMARVGDVALLEKPADNKSPKRIDCFWVTEHSASGAAFRLDPAQLVYTLRWMHRAQPPDLDLMLADWVGPLWINAANLTLLGEMRRRAPDAVDWGPLLASGVVDTLDAFENWRDGQVKH